jgi:hypothetical protein
MSYFRASTANPTGWRPGTVLLGNMASRQHQGPDWKTVAAQHAASVKAGKQIQHARQNQQRRRMNAIDAAARGDRTRVRTPRLSGLGLNAINLGGQMVAGFPYVFHFSWGGLGIAPDMNAIASQIAADSNFSNPVATKETSGVQVAFTYSGQGSTVANAGSEMQTVINTFGLMGIDNSLNFYAAEGGPATQTTSSQPVVVQNSDGTVTIVSPSTPPGVAPASSGGFDLTSFAGGLGIGGAVALALGGVLLLKSL